MFILPIFRAIDWRRPPIFTLLLILINCVVFFGFQSRDGALEEKAVDYYRKSELPSIEFPLYLQYLREGGQISKARDLDPYVRNPGFESVLVFRELENDGGFQSKIRSGTLLTQEDPKYTVWTEQRKQYRRMVGSTVLFRFGLAPVEPKPVTFLSHMFLHGDFSHLLGNMIFLFALGFVVESVVPKWVFAISYLAAGVGAAALDVAMHPLSNTVSIGASGAISGLMGMYTLLFGLRKVKMFYFVLIYFDFFTAPAIILLPIWLGHELYQLYGNSGSHINYTAHIGGLLAGALLGLIFRRLFPLVDDVYIDAPDRDAAYGRRLATALDHMAALRYNMAKPLLISLADEKPDNFDIWLHLFQVAKSNPDGPHFHNSVQRIANLAARNPESLQRIQPILAEYFRLAEHPQIESAELLRLAKRFAEKGQLDAASQLTDRVLAEHQEAEGASVALLSLALALQKEKRADASLSRLRQLISMYPASSEAIEGQRLLNSLEAQPSTQSGVN